MVNIIKKVFNCVDCQLPCLHTSCPNYEVESVVCDLCGDRAKYHMDDLDYCTTCAEEDLTEWFRSLTVKEKAGVLGIDISEYVDG